MVVVNSERWLSLEDFDGRLGKRSQKLLEETILGESVGCLFPPDF